MAIPCTLHRGVLSFPKCPPHSSSSASTSEYPKNLKNPPTHPKNKKIKTSHIFHLDAYSLNGNPKFHLFLEPEPQPRLSFHLENPNPWKPNLICVFKGWDRSCRQHWIFIFSNESNRLGLFGFSESEQNEAERFCNESKMLGVFGFPRWEEDKKG